MFCGQIICNQLVMNKADRTLWTCYILHVVKEHPEEYQLPKPPDPV
jgi:hypothetical protein